VLPSARIGGDCNICDGVFIENDVVIGDRVTVKGGVQLWDGLRVGNDVFIGPNATFTNDKFPRSKAYQATLPTTCVADGASIGANATILPGVTIGTGAMVGAAAFVTGDVPPKAIVVGSPARIAGYVDAVAHPQSYGDIVQPDGPAQVPTSVHGVTLHRMRTAVDLRGSLSAAEFGSDVPFQVERVFLVYDVPSKDVRGEHAHKQCEQFLVCVHGSVVVMVDDGDSREEVILDSPGVGLRIPPMVWGVQYKYSEDAVLMVLASEHYDASDYLRDYDEFLRLIEHQRSIGSE